METIAISPLYYNHVPLDINTYKGGHDYDQVFRTQSIEHCYQLQRFKKWSIELLNVLRN